MENNREMRKDVLAIFILIPVFIGSLVSLFTRNSVNIYSSIKVPSFAPPGFIFPIVWIILYILMGISSYLVYETGKKEAKKALITYAVQLVMNAVWSFIFFNGRAFLAAFIWLILLLIAIVLMIVEFAKINKTAAYLQIPYLLWVTFAGVLNFSIYLMNR